MAAVAAAGWRVDYATAVGSTNWTQFAVTTPGQFYAKIDVELIRPADARCCALIDQRKLQGLSKWFAVAGAFVIGVIAYVFLRRRDVGQGRFFADQTYHFQTLRVLNDVPSDGADTAEVLETIKHIRSGDAQGWFRAWSDTGDRVARSAAATTDGIAKGRALLRAHSISAPFL